MVGGKWRQSKKRQHKQELRKTARKKALRPRRKKARGVCEIPKFEFSISELEQMSQSQWLTDRERKAFDFFYRRGWSIEDIAAELDVNRSTVTRDLMKIRRKTASKFF